MELIIAILLFALIVATWLFLPGSLMDQTQISSPEVVGGPARRTV